MERKQLHLGPGAASLILVIVVISMSILSLLSLLEVRSDTRLTERSTELITAQYDASVQAEHDLMLIDGAVLQAHENAADEDGFLLQLGSLLPDYMTLDNNVVSWSVNVNESTDLMCSVRVNNTGDTNRVTWIRHLYESRLGQEDME